MITLKPLNTKEKAAEALEIGSKALNSLIKSGAIKMKGRYITRAELEAYKPELKEVNAVDAGQSVDTMKPEIKPEDKAEMDAFDARKTKALKEFAAINAEKEAEEAVMKLEEIKGIRDKPAQIAEREKLVNWREYLIDEKIDELNEKEVKINNFHNFTLQIKNDMDNREKKLLDAEARLKNEIENSQRILNANKNIADGLINKARAECDKMKQDAVACADKIKKEAEEHNAKIEADYKQRIDKMVSVLGGVEKRISEIKENYQTQYRPLIDNLKEWDDYIRGIRNQAMYQNAIKQSRDLTNSIQIVKSSLKMYGGI